MNLYIQMCIIHFIHMYDRFDPSPTERHWTAAALEIPKHASTTEMPPSLAQLIGTSQNLPFLKPRWYIGGFREWGYPQNGWFISKGISHQIG